MNQHLLQFAHWLEANDPFFNLRPGWKDTGLSDSEEGRAIAQTRGFHGDFKSGLQPLGNARIGDSEANREAAPVWAAFPQTQVKFIIHHVCDQLMEDFEQEGEHEGFNILDVLKRGDVPYYLHNPNEDRSIPRRWVQVVNDFVHKILTTDPKVREALTAAAQGKPLDKKRLESYAWRVTVFLEGYIARELRERMMKKYGQADFEVQIYGVKQGFGGEEEGGWYYDHYDLLKTIPVKGLTAAYRKYKQLEKMYEGKGKDSFLDDMAKGHGGAHEIEDWEYEATGDAGQEGMDIPRAWTTSSYRRYEVVMRLHGSETKETGQPPTYR